MIKTGEVRAAVTPCDQCGEPSTTVVGGKACCAKHGQDKQAGCPKSLKSFTEPLDQPDGKSD